MKYLFVCAAISLVCVQCSKSNNYNGTTVNGTDSYFAQQASYANLDEVGAGNIAAVKASNDSVRAFGGTMITENTNAQLSLDSLGTSLNIVLPTTADSLHQVMASQLQLLSDSTFDTTYINQEVRDHIAAVSLYQTEISAGNNQQIKNYAQTYLPVIQMRLQEAQTIQQMIQ
jgi:putative membrane protein